MCVFHQLILEIGRAHAKTQHDHEKFTQTLFESERIWTILRVMLKIKKQKCDKVVMKH